jgi:hypothetical protein
LPEDYGEWRRGTMLCPSCSHDNPEGSQFCRGCGAALQIEIACPNCGSVHPLGSKFCNKCGQRLNEAAPAPPAHTPTPAPSPALPTSFASGRYKVKRFPGEGGRSYVHEREPQALMSEMGPGAADIARVVSEVRERLPGLPTPPALEPEQARFRLFDSIMTFLKNTESRQPVVLALGDQRWLELLHEHNAIVRKRVAAHEGFEVKAEGDGFMLAFQSARRALQCAIDTQRAFAERNESADEVIRVRIGLHTGEAIKEADDFYGKNVILAARIAAQARGGVRSWCRRC